MISAKAVKIHVEFYSFLYIIEVDVSLLRNYKGMPKTFVYTAITVKKQMPVEKSCSAVLNVHPVQPATKPVRISKRNGAADLIRRLMYVMAVQ